MKKILQITNYYYPHIGGIEQVTRDIANVLRDEPDYEVRILCFNEDARDGDLVCRRGETKYDHVDGVEVIRCGCFTKVSSQSLSLAFGRELKKVMNAFRPDIVIFHYPNPFQARYLLRSLRKYDCKLIVYWHLDIIRQKVLRLFFHRQTLRILDRADVVVPTSPLYIDGSDYLQSYRSKCKSIPNSISESRMRITEEAKSLSEKIKAENKGKIICFGVGRHIPYKGFSYLIKTSRLLDDRFRIFIGGQGELTEQLKEEARGDNKVVFLGRLGIDELIAYYLAMDIFCFPSITKNEAFGIALAEAMYFAKPAVTFHIHGSGVNYVNLAGVTGLECPNGDSHAYAEALKKLASDPGLRADLGKAARERVVNNFTEKQFRENILDLLKDK